MSKRLAHRPQRSFPDAERVIIECELETCIHCGGVLAPSGTWHMRKYVQTLNGPLFVAGKSKKCDTPDCSHRNHHYHARSEEHTSELQSQAYLVCRLLLEKKKKQQRTLKKKNSDVS